MSITTKKYNTYELDGKLLQVGTKINDNINPDYPWSIDYTDYFYYDHDGVVAEQQENGNTKYFTRAGRELLSCKDNGGNYFYIQNACDDVIMLVNADGKTAAIRDYDSTGRLLSRAPDERTDRDPFGFTGGLDAGKGLWKLGARFYDSSKNSFIQQDRYMGDPSDPLSLNRYVYCGLDPVNMVDPTGFKQIYAANFKHTVIKSDFPNPILAGIVRVAQAIIPLEPAESGILATFGEFAKSQSGGLSYQPQIGDVLKATTTLDLQGNTIYGATNWSIQAANKQTYTGTSSMTFTYNPDTRDWVDQNGMSWDSTSTITSHLDYIYFEGPFDDGTNEAAD